MWSLLLDIIWRKWWKIIAVDGFGLLTIYSVIIENCFPNAGLPTMRNFLPGWGWWIWALIFLASFSVATFLVAYQQRRQLESHDNWIVVHKARHGKLPTMPDYLLPLVNNYSPGSKISKNIKVKKNLQYWHSLLDNSQERFLQLLDWLGIDRQGYLQQLRDTAPPGGSGTIRLHTKRKWE